MTTSNPRIALMWRGDPRAHDAPTRYEPRLQPVFDALRAAGFAPEPAIYFDNRADEMRTRLAECAAVLVWINPIADGADRTIVDQVLRDAAAAGVWVSAHPDVIDKMATKRVLFDTRDLGWGSDTDLYETAGDFETRFPARAARTPRVLKPHRGNDGQGVLKVVHAGEGIFDVQRASDDSHRRVALAELKSILRPLFDASVPLIDQEFHEVTRSGMVRCYMSGPRVVGFGLQVPRAQNLEHAFAMNSDKVMHGREFAPLADLRASMEEKWTPAMQRVLSIATRDLPALWDADFLYRTRQVEERGRFALCEINASCVSPFPASAAAAIVNAARLRLKSHN